MNEKPHRDPVLLSYQVGYCAYTLLPGMSSHVSVDLSYSHQFAFQKGGLGFFSHYFAYQYLNKETQKSFLLIN